MISFDGHSNLKKGALGNVFKWQHTISICIQFIILN